MYSWKFLPIIFTVWLTFQILVFIYVRNKLVELQTIGFPISFEQAQQFAKVMQNYLQTEYTTLLFFQVSNFLFLQTWCIPGTFMFNLLAGALFGMKVGFISCLLCNTLGAFFCFMLSKLFMQQLTEKYFEEHANSFSQKIHSQKGIQLFLLMVSLRVFPGSPNWAMNITFPHIKIPSLYFVFSILIGLIPWNFLTCKAGLIISTFKSKDEIMNRENYIYLILFSLLLLSPSVVKYIQTRKENNQKLL